MKQIKNITLAVLSGLLILSVATVSCKKKSGGSSSSTAPTISGITPSANDTLGQTIQIVGTNFAGATVTIGGIAATNVSIAATVINATIPAGVTVGTVVVKVTTATGSATFNITVVSVSSLFHTADLKTSSNQVETSSLIGNWTFDGTENVTSGSNSTGPQLNGGTITYVTGRIGQAAHFANAWLTYPNTAIPASADNSGGNGSNDTLKAGFSVSLWAQMPDTSTLSTLFALYSPNIPNWPLLGIDYRKSGGIYAVDGGIGMVDAVNPWISYASFYGINFNDSLTWAHFVITYDSTSKNFIYYANDIKIKTWAPSDLTGAGMAIDSAFNIVAPNYPTIGTNEGIGRTPGDVSNTLASYMADGITGNIDDIRFYNIALTATDVDDLYQLGNHGQ